MGEGLLGRRNKGILWDIVGYCSWGRTRLVVETTGKRCEEITNELLDLIRSNSTHVTNNMSSLESCVDHDKEETLQDAVLKPALKTHSANHLGFVTIRNRSPFQLYLSGAGNEAGYYLNHPKSAFEKTNRNPRYEVCLSPDKVGAFAHLENYSGSFWKNTSLAASLGGLYVYAMNRVCGYVAVDVWDERKPDNKIFLGTAILTYVNTMTRSRSRIGAEIRAPSSSAVISAEAMAATDHIGDLDKLHSYTESSPACNIMIRCSLDNVNRFEFDVFSIN